jgi:uncharacterized protein
MTRSIAILAALLLSAAGSVCAGENIPAVTRRVNDYAGAISAPQSAELEAKLAAHERATSNQIVVVLIKSLDGRDIESVSLQTATAWRLGQKGRDNGVLLFVALNDRRMRIEVGRGLEGALPDIVCGRIIREEIGPRFKQGQYYQGIAAGTDRIIQAIKGEYSATPGKASGALFLVVPLFIFLFIVVMVVVSIKRAIGGGGHWSSGGGSNWGGDSSGGGGGGGGDSFSGGGGGFSGGGASGSW